MTVSHSKFTEWVVGEKHTHTHTHTPTHGERGEIVGGKARQRQRP